MRKQLISVIALLLCIGCFLSACGSKNSAPTASGASGGYMDDKETYAPVASEEASWDASAANGIIETVAPSQSLIMTYSANLELETLDYAASLASIQEAIKQAKGYVSSQQSSGGYASYDGYYYPPFMEMVVKIPAANFQSFLEKADGYGNVVSLNSWQEDITSGYLDTQARLNSLQAQKDRLMELMEKAETVEDLITIEYHLSDVIYQIESTSSQMKAYQNMADYSTVTIYLREVRQVTYQAQTFGERLVARLKTGWNNFVEAVQEFILGVVGAIPFLIILGLLVVAILLIVKKAKKRKEANRKKMWEEAQKQEEQNKE